LWSTESSRAGASHSARRHRRASGKALDEKLAVCATVAQAAECGAVARLPAQRSYSPSQSTGSAFAAPRRQIQSASPTAREGASSPRVRDRPQLGRTPKRQVLLLRLELSWISTAPVAGRTSGACVSSSTRSRPRPPACRASSSKAVAARRLIGDDVVGCHGWVDGQFAGEHVVWIQHGQCAPSSGCPTVRRPSSAALAACLDRPTSSGGAGRHKWAELPAGLRSRRTC